MNDNHNDTHNAPQSAEPPRDELDQLLRDWHDSNHERAAAGRDRLLQSLAHLDDQPDDQPDDQSDDQPDAAPPPPIHITTRLRRVAMHRVTHAVAAALLLAGTIAILIPGAQPTHAATRLVMCPEGGLLEAFDPRGNLLGPCELTHTDYDVSIAGPFARVNLTQQYTNPHRDVIEAVYTFPMSHRGAVDRMTMTIGDRVIEGEIKEREEARSIYSAAKAAGRVTSLLEQERPNIFTQSVANIEPGAEITIQISYVETIDAADGTYTFSLPTTVAPRYIPGTPTTSDAERIQRQLPDHCTQRPGAVLLGPAQITIDRAGATDGGTLTGAQLTAALPDATPIEIPRIAPPPGGGLAPSPRASIWLTFNVRYGNGLAERGELYSDGTGKISERWFWFDTNAAMNATNPRNDRPAHADTTQVPDASRIVPPIAPTNRAGHDIAIRVTVDTGGPGIVDLDSELHEITRTDAAFRDDGIPRRATLALRRETELPNRDFVLSWKQTDDQIEHATFIHTDPRGGFITMMLQPPARIDDADAVARELCFVLDVSGSMKGEPIAKAKRLLTAALATMRPQDTFNIITFANQTTTLWPEPRPATPQNVARATAFFGSNAGGGGTEMMNAIRAALTPSKKPPAAEALSPAQLANTPADGRNVTVLVPAGNLDTGRNIRVRDDLVITTLRPSGSEFSTDHDTRIEGSWRILNGERVLLVSRTVAGVNAAESLKLVVFLSDGEVGNDMAILDAVKNKPANTRVFPFLIGNGANRYLMDNMGRLGAGKADYVLQTTDVQQAVDRFATRINTPVLTSIGLAFDGIELTDTVPPLDEIHDLYDVEPLVIHARFNPAAIAPNARPTVTLTGNTAAGPSRQVIPIDVSPDEPSRNDQVATLWARATVEHLMNQDLDGAQQNRIQPDLKQRIIELAIDYRLLTQYTAFVAVDKLRITTGGGTPRLVRIPVELPNDASWDGYFGPATTQEQLAVLLGQPPATVDRDTARFQDSVGGPGVDLGARVNIEARAPDMELDGVLFDRITPRNDSDLMLSLADTHPTEFGTSAAGTDQSGPGTVTLLRAIDNADGHASLSVPTRTALSRMVGTTTAVTEQAPGTINIEPDLSLPHAITLQDGIMVGRNRAVSRELGRAYRDSSSVDYVYIGGDPSSGVYVAGPGAARATNTTISKPAPARSPATRHEQSAGRVDNEEARLLHLKEAFDDATKQEEDERLQRQRGRRSASPATPAPAAVATDDAEPGAVAPETEPGAGVPERTAGAADIDGDDAPSIAPAPTPDRLNEARDLVKQHLRQLVANTPIELDGDLSEHWAHPLVIPRLIQALIQLGDLDNATSIATLYANNNPNDSLLRELKETVATDPNPDQLTALIKRSDERLQKHLRNITRARRLSPDLHLITAAIEAGNEDEDEDELLTQLRADPTVDLTDAGLLVTILAEASLSISELVRTGLAIEHTTHTGLIVGRIHLDKLDTLATLRSIRRIEPTRTD